MMFSAKNPLRSDCGAPFVGAAQMQQFQRRTEWTPAVTVQHSNYLPVNYSQSLHTSAPKKLTQEVFNFFQNNPDPLFHRNCMWPRGGEATRGERNFPPCCFAKYLSLLFISWGYSFFLLSFFFSRRQCDTHARTHARHLTISSDTDNCRKTSLRSKSVFP